MRNPKRLDSFYNELKEIHAEYFPDWRFGQFMLNFFGWVTNDKKRDMFFPEEAETMKLLKEYCAECQSPFSNNPKDVFENWAFDIAVIAQDISEEDDVVVKSCSGFDTELEAMIEGEKELRKIKTSSPNGSFALRTYRLEN